MFTDFQRVWTPVFLRKHLRNKPVKLTIAGEPIVLFRNTAGVAGALLDRCPHRGVALSLGRRTADGFLKCAFHGWEFDTAGVCQHVPFNAQAKRDNLCATTFPVYEGGGLIWLYTEPTRQPVAPPFIPEGLSQADLTIFHSDVLWRAHWTRVMENMMDNAHVPFVHRRTIGWALQRALRRDSRLCVTSEATPTGLMIKGVQDDTMIVGV